MSYECRFLDGTFCNRRVQECNPGERGCVLEGRFTFPLKKKERKHSGGRKKKADALGPNSQKF